MLYRLTRPAIKQASAERRDRVMTEFLNVAVITQAVLLRLSNSNTPVRQMAASIAVEHDVLRRYRYL